MRNLGIVFFILCFQLHSFSQNFEFSNLRYVKALLKDSFVLDSQPIIPGSLSFFYEGKQIDNSFFGFHSAANSIYSKKVFSDSISIYYRVLPLPMTSSKFVKRRRGKGIYKKELYNVDALNLNENSNSLGDLNYSGSFVRGITVGNRQDAAVNSGFNLNINGKLPNGLEINATMTDANIPIQPEGNSASIQEFDRIFIQLKKDSHKITLGDFDIQQNNNFQLMRFDRKLQGIRYQTSIPISKQSKLSLGATAALTRGTFARNVFQAEENNQGPYKLFGNNGEAFIIIIAGTERVFINGQEMKRGLENDYTINYNVGEVVFTPNRLITQDLRIVVEFQYSDRSYFRYSLEGNMSLEHDKYELYTQVFTENDNKNSPVNLELQENQVQRLSQIGNNLDSAIIESSRPVDWESNRITYVRVDTVIAGLSYSYYKWAETETDSTFQLLFTQVGFNRGDYILKATAANGSVYEWVSPVGGVPQGNYEPNIKITTPKTHLQWTTGGLYKWNQSQTSKLELSYTQNDLNTFSTIDDNQNKGIGFVFNHNIQHKLDSFKIISIGLEQEYTSDNFSPLTRYRNNEFQRDWSLNLPIRNAQEQSISSIQLGLQTKAIETSLKSSYFFIPNRFNASQSRFQFQWRKGRFGFSTNQSLVYSIEGDSTHTFYRPKASTFYDLVKDKSRFEIGFDHEFKKFVDKNDELIGNGFIWQNYFVKWDNKFTDHHDLNFQYIYRTEATNDSVEFQPPHVKAHTFSIQGRTEFSNSQNLKYVLRYRNFSSSIQNQEIQHNYLGRIDYTSFYARGFIMFNTSYELKAGREQKMQLTYIKAPNGFGAYAWQDLNNNGTFEVNEAYVSPILTENNFMRFFVVLPEFLPANEVSLSQQISIRPKAKWHNKLGLKKALSKFSYQMRLDINKKIRLSGNNGFLDYANPWVDYDELQLIFARSNIFQQISFQKNENKVGFDLEWVQNNANNLLSNGVEGYSNTNYALRARVQLFHFLTYISRLSNGLRRNTSEFFAERNFGIVENGLENKLSFLVNRNMKINLNADYTFRSSGNQFAISQQGDIEFKLARKNNGIVESRFTLLNLNYEAMTPNPQIQLAMLNGIPNGLNYIWNLTIGQKITKFLQLNLIYNGRKNDNTPGLIHSGNVEVRAIF